MGREQSLEKLPKASRTMGREQSLEKLPKASRTMGREQSFNTWDNFIANSLR